MNFSNIVVNKVDNRHADNIMANKHTMSEKIFYIIHNNNSCTIGLLRRMKLEWQKKSKTTS